jgi:glycosyltransferase involved in cell wall biosynthesis
MIEFTVAICTYNGENRLPNVLEKLRCQIGTETFNWEIIVVDNSSKDNTGKVVREYQANWSKVYPIQYYMEPEQGLAFARRCAIKHANSPLIGFLDDDNLPNQNWVAAAYKFAVEHPKIGAFGGQIHGKFEGKPPVGFERIARYFALIQGDIPYCYNCKYKKTSYKMFPPGAGIVIRKEAWLASIPERPLLPQTSEDIEMLSQIWQAGWEIWFNPEMEIEHVIPESRFDGNYLKRFFRENGLCRYYVRMLKYKRWQMPLVIPGYMANDLRKLMCHWFKYRKVLKDDKVAAGEMELLLTTVLSPFYIGRQKLTLK